MKIFYHRTLKVGIAAAFSITFFVLLLLQLSSFTYVWADSDTATGGQAFSISKEAAPRLVAPGSTVTYSITVRNLASVNLSPKRIEDTLPDGFTFIGNSKLTTVSGEQLEFNPSTSDNKLTWVFDGDTLQTIPPNQSIVVTYQVRSSTNTGSYTNRACLVDPENICSSSTVSVTTNPEAGLTDSILIALLILIPGGMLASHIYEKNRFENRVLNS